MLKDIENHSWKDASKRAWHLFSRKKAQQKQKGSDFFTSGKFVVIPSFRRQFPLTSMMSGPSSSPGVWARLARYGHQFQVLVWLIEIQLFAEEQIYVDIPQSQKDIFCSDPSTDKCISVTFW